MKKFLIILLAFIPFSSFAWSATPFPDKDRLKEYNVYGTSLYLLKDNKTGCEYVRSGGGDSWAYLRNTCNKGKE